MNDPFQNFIKTIEAMRQAVIKSGGKPDKIYISKAAIEDMKIFGMEVEVSEFMPKDVSVFVLDSKRYKIRNHYNALLGFAEGLAEDVKPFMDLLKIEGYFTENMELTPKGKQVLKEYWEKQYAPPVVKSGKFPTAKDLK